MRLHEAIESGLPFKRLSDIKFRTDVQDILLDKEDLLRDYWEVERVPKTSHSFGVSGSSTRYIIQPGNDDSSPLYMSIIDPEQAGVSFTEDDVDIILDVIMNTTKVGKSRITPF